MTLMKVTLKILDNLSRCSLGCIVSVLLEGVECQLVFSESQQEEEVRDPNR